MENDFKGGRIDYVMEKLSVMTMKPWYYIVYEKIAMGCITLREFY